MRGIIISENEILTNVLNGNIGDKPINSIRILIKYYFHNGKNKDEIYNLINNYMNENYNGYIPSKWSNIIKNMIKTISKCNSYELFNINEIIITENEWNKILELNNKQLEKLAFILLIYVKVNQEKNPQCNGWINQNLSDIFKESCIDHNIIGENTTKLLHKLYEINYISQKKSCNATSLKINYLDNNSNPKIIINNFENVISYYYEFKNNFKYVECEICKKRVVQKSKKPKKYCNKCAKKVKQEQINRLKREKRLNGIN